MKLNEAILKEAEIKKGDVITAYDEQWIVMKTSSRGDQLLARNKYDKTDKKVFYMNDLKPLSKTGARKTLWGIDKGGSFK